MMNENSIAREIVDSAFQIHMELGPGLLESVYEALLADELESRGLVVERQVEVPLEWRGRTFDVAFRADLIVNDLVIVEVKATREALPVYKRQTLTYVKLSRKRLGLLINFGMYRFKDGVARLINGDLDS